MRRRSQLLVAAAMLVPIGLLLWLIWPPDVNQRLRVRGIPEVSEYESCIGVHEGGFFNLWLLIALQATDAQMTDYVAKLTRDGAEFKPLGNRAGQVRIVETATYEEPPWSVDLPKIYFKETMDGERPSWWKIEQATSGEFFDKQLPDAQRYRVIFDREHGIIYIYWHYS